MPRGPSPHRLAARDPRSITRLVASANPPRGPLWRTQKFADGFSDAKGCLHLRSPTAATCCATTPRFLIPCLEGSGGRSTSGFSRRRLGAPFLTRRRRRAGPRSRPPRDDVFNRHAHMGFGRAGVALSLVMAVVLIHYLTRS